MTLVEFLLARIAEDEARAGEPWLHVLDDVRRWWDLNEDEDEHFAVNQPDDVKGLAKDVMQIESIRGAYIKVLTECEAKRKIVELHDGPHWDMTLAALAAVYSDHPDHDEAWRA